jgi:hypothetical protein
MELPPSIPEPVREYSVPTILSVILCIVFGPGTFIISFTALVWPGTSMSMWGLLGFLTALLSLSLLYKEPEQIFGEESGTARYGYAAVFEWFFIVGSAFYWILILTSATDFEIGIGVTTAFLVMGIFCVLLVTYRVFTVYRLQCANQQEYER